MPRTIDVTGLPPEAVQAIEKLVEMIRKQPAPNSAARPPAGVGQPSGEVPPSQLPYEEWVKWYRAWVDSHPRLDVIADDTRESIYDRDTE